MEEKRNTIVAGKETGEVTESGNNIHNADGTFGSSQGESDVISDKTISLSPEDLEELNNINFDNDIDIKELIFGKNEENSISENKPKNVEEMSNEELIKEIKDCKEFFKLSGLDFSEFGDAFNNDFKLQCSNFRQLKNILKKYKLDLNGCKFINSHHYKKSSDSVAAMSCIRKFDFLTNSWEFVSNVEMTFNAKRFLDYNTTKNGNKKEVEKGFWSDVSDENLSNQSITHELGHAVHNQMFIDYLKTNDMNHFTNKTQIIKDIKKFVEDFRKDVYKQYIKDNDVISYDDFKKMNSEYGVKYGVEEWFAEMFSNVNCGKPTKVALAFDKVLKNRGYVKGEI